MVAGEVLYPVSPSESPIYISEIDKRTVLAVGSRGRGGGGGGRRGTGVLEIELYIFL